MIPVAVLTSLAVGIILNVLLVPQVGVVRSAVASCLAYLATIGVIDACRSILTRWWDRPAPSPRIEIAPGPGVRPGLARRALDLLVSALALVVLAPAFMVIGITVRATSRGPAIYRQLRVGEGGGLFHIIKFRTMRVGGSGAEVTIPHDPRITPIGRFLRATSLDELPQFLNVLAGQMTLVGPRPETPALAARYPQSCQQIFRYRPGLTGVVQLRLRDTDVLPTTTLDPESYYLLERVPERVAVDMEYLRNPTMGTTIRLLGQTAVQVATRAVIQTRRQMRRELMDRAATASLRTEPEEAVPPATE